MKKKNYNYIIELMKEALPNTPIKITDDKGNVIYESNTKKKKKKQPVVSKS